MYGYEYQDHLTLKKRLVRLWQETDGKTVAEAWVLPEFGANLCRLKIDGNDYIYPAAEEVADFRHYGSPILCPFPGEMTDEKFTFDGQLYRFPANRGDVFRHGFVMGEKFNYSTPEVTEESVTFKTSIGITPDHPLYSLFPIVNRLDLNFTLQEKKLKIDVRITNEDPEKRLPFGFGIHPYFNIIGPRNTVKVLVPMQKWLNAETHSLQDPAESPADLRQPVSLDGLVIDEVWTGMVPEQPHCIFYESIGKKMSISASDIFTHSVTYCPEGADFCCLENWTSSYDAHNLYTKGKQEIAHLLILNPAESITGTLEFAVENI